MAAILATTDIDSTSDVVDVALHTVKVQNFDKTIVTIPTYKLTEGSFRNWRGMKESQGRRIKRAVILDMTSIRFCDREMLDRFKRFQAISDYVDRKIEEVQRHRHDGEDQEPEGHQPGERVGEAIHPPRHREDGLKAQEKRGYPRSPRR